MGRNLNSIDKINYIVHFLADHCDAPLQVYIKSLLPALFEAFATWYALDMVQIFTAYARPDGPLRGVRGGGHGPSRSREEASPKKKKKPKGRFRTWVNRARVYVGFDPWDAMGRQLQLPAGQVVRSTTPGIETLWEVYGLEQRLLYWFMIYEVVVDGLYTWSNGVAMSSYCQQQYRPWVFTERSSFADPGVPGGAGVLLPPATKARWGSAGPGNGVQCEGFGSICIVSAKTASKPSNFGAKMKLVSGSGQVFEGNTVFEADEGIEVRGSDPYETEWFVVFDGGGVCFGADLKVTLMGNPVDGGVYHQPKNWKEIDEKSFRPAGQKRKKTWFDEFLESGGDHKGPVT